MVVQLSDPGTIGMVWIDLETTGADLPDGEIIEIGALYTDFQFNQIGDPFHLVIEPSDKALGQLVKNDVVREMHTKNELLSDCISSMARVHTISAADYRIVDWLDQCINLKKHRGPVKKFRFQLAGSGVSHFDRKYIDYWMPVLSSLLHFRPYDITHVRQAFRFAGAEPSAENGDRKDHRALGDIQLHLEEARTYNQMLQLFTKCTNCGRSGEGCKPDPKHPGYYFCAAGTGCRPEPTGRQNKKGTVST